uniref:(California timema) hypothetical protein n=1 Tax=Timema californicum TaxID=61474 RepID=A0A7R9PCQ6_TIMCA|nr:unnamed protein product [Timema californicum]
MRERHIRVQALSKDISQMGTYTRVTAKVKACLLVHLFEGKGGLSQQGQQRASNSGSVECGFCRGEHLGVYCRRVETSQLGLASVSVWSPWLRQLGAEYAAILPFMGPKHQEELCGISIQHY